MIHSMNYYFLFNLFHRYCEKRRKALLDHVYEGYDQDWWNYTE